MRTMLLSFKSSVYDNVKSGKKIYEHRKVFPDCAVKAYLYISAPVKAIEGILYLSNKTDLLEWKEKFKDDECAVSRIDSYLKQHRYAMEINAYQKTNRIPLQKLRNDLPGFVVPQMYYFIDDKPLSAYLESNLKPEGERVIHTFQNITSEDICLL